MLQIVLTHTTSCVQSCRRRIEAKWGHGLKGLSLVRKSCRFLQKNLSVVVPFGVRVNAAWYNVVALYGVTSNVLPLPGR